MHLRVFMLVACIGGLSQAAAQQAAPEAEPDELRQLRRDTEIQTLAKGKVLTEQFANALATIARDAGAEGDYEQALAAQRRREGLIRLYTTSMDEPGLSNAILLKPADAKLSGAVNYDRSLNLLVNWKTTGSVATWDVNRITPGSYDVALTYAVADMGEPGRTVVAGVAPDLTTGGDLEFYEDSSLPGADQNRRTGTVQSTGGWTEWKVLTLPAIQITRPSARLALKVTKARGDGGVMHLKEIRLSPAAAIAATDDGTQPAAGGPAPTVDEFSVLQQAYTDRLKEVMAPIVNSYSESLQALAYKHAGAAPEAATDFNAEARRATQLLEEPEAVLAGPSKGPRPGPNIEGFRELRDAAFVPDPRNTGDTFKVRQGEEQFFVRLLWVSCPAPEKGDGKLQSEYARYFGISAEDVEAIGRQAQEFTESYLAGKPLTLLTRGRKDSDDNLLVSVRAGRLGDFAGALVDNGLAMIKEPEKKKGAASQHDETIVRMLHDRETTARTREIPAGAWARRDVE